MYTDDRLSSVSLHGSKESTKAVGHQLRWSAGLIDLRPPSLSPTAIVCVRWISVPVKPPRRLDPGPWAQVSAEVARALPEAVHPARGPVSPGARIVVFADEAELLACLARDVVANPSSTSWWWRSLFGSQSLIETARREWLARARLIPSALTRLFNRADVAPFLQLFSETELEALGNRVADEFHQVALRQAWPSRNSLRHDNEDSSPELQNLPPRQAVRPPWQEWLTIPVGLSEGAERLLVFAVIAHRAPSLTYSAGFAQHVAHWRRTARSAQSVKPGPPSTGGSLLGNQIVPTESKFPDIPEIGIRPGEAARTIPNHAAPQNPVARKKSRVVPERLKPMASDLALTADNSKPPEAEWKPGSASLGDTRELDEASAISAADLSELHEPITTQYGGLFYLVNVALALGLYSDFTQPTGPGLAMSLWDFLRLMGRSILNPRFVNDPIDVLLARLAGRESHENPASDFSPPNGKPLQEWLDETIALFRARLVAALGPIDRETELALVFIHSAQVMATSTRVDIHFRLAEHPIELRLAGLDRDPGWIPAGGRTLAFHYE